jgi:hypothetical protein
LVGLLIETPVLMGARSEGLFFHSTNSNLNVRRISQPGALFSHCECGAAQKTVAKKGDSCYIGCVS